MPFRKYKSVIEMPEHPTLTPLDGENLRVACELTELAYGLRSWRLEPGVHKFASFEEWAASRLQRERIRPAKD